MGLPLYIPWFRAEAWEVPTLYAIAAVVVGSAIAAINPKWRAQAIQTGGFLVAVGVIASFKWDEIPIQPFGILVATGVLLGTRLGEWRAKQTGIDPILLADFATHVVVIGFISCYILNGIFYEPEKLMRIINDPSKLFEEWLGLSSFGGFFGAMFGIWVWKKRKERPGEKLPVLRVVDAAGFGLPLGWFFGRMGCFVVHDHPGKETDFFLGVQDYPVVVDGLPVVATRHDLGLYEVIWSGLVVLLFVGIRNVKKPIGFHPVALMLLYAPVRFMLDYLRVEDADMADTRFASLTPGQYSSLIFFVIAIGLMAYLRKHTPAPIPDRWAWPPKKDRRRSRGERARRTGLRQCKAPKKRGKKK